jgi:hypothetical protein
VSVALPQTKTLPIPTSWDCLARVLGPIFFVFLFQLWPLFVPYGLAERITLCVVIICGALTLLIVMVLVLFGLVPTEMRWIMLGLLAAISAVAVFPEALALNERLLGIPSTTMLIAGAALFCLVRVREDRQQWWKEITYSFDHPWRTLLISFLPCLVGNACWLAYGARGNWWLLLPGVGFFVSFVFVCYYTWGADECDDPYR